MTPPTVGSLFTGVGGLDLGLERAGMEVRWQVEIEPFCNRVLAKHWPAVARYGDIRGLTGNELERVDLVCGGYPCQPFSQAGKRGGESDARHLWPEFARLLRVLRPRYVLLENVPGHLSLGFRRVLGDLAGLGYDAEWMCLRASEFGAAHLRKRVFIVGYLANPHPAERHSGDNALADPGDRLVPQPRRGPEGRDGAGPAGAVLPFAPGPSDPRWPAILRDYPWLAPALEAPAEPGHGRVADGISTILHRAMKDRTKRLRALGNSVVPQVAEWVGRRIMRIMEARMKGRAA